METSKSETGISAKRSPKHHKGHHIKTTPSDLKPCCIDPNRNVSAEMREQISEGWGLICGSIAEGVEDAVEDAVIESSMDGGQKFAKMLTDFILQEGLFSNRIIGFFLGIILFLAGFLNFLFHLLTLNLILTPLDGCAMICGITCVALEYKFVFLPSRIKHFLESDFLCVFTPYGRALTFLFWGLFFFSFGSFKDVAGIENGLVGVVVTIASCWLLYNAFKAISNANFVRAKMVETDYDMSGLISLFNSHVNLDGELGVDGFKNICEHFAVEMKHEDIDVVFLHLKGRYDGELTWKQFLAWYEAGLPDDDDDDDDEGEGVEKL